MRRFWKKMEKGLAMRGRGRGRVRCPGCLPRWFVVEREERTAAED